MDGYAATRQWREIEAVEDRPRLPILALTAHAMADDRRKCLDAGMDDYLTKPLKLESLRAVLSRMVDAAPEAAQLAAQPHAEHPPS
jgi:CheY-like chemotaxis protein